MKGILKGLSPTPRARLIVSDVNRESQNRRPDPKEKRNGLDRLFNSAVAEAGIKRSDIEYVVAGFGRHMVPFSHVTVTDLTASARGLANLTAS